MSRAVGFVIPDIPDGVLKGSQWWLAPKRFSCAWEEPGCGLYLEA